MMKSNLELVQDLVESRLDGLNEKLDTNNKNLADKIDTNNKHVVQMLNLIKEQTTKTNGRVGKAEDDIKKLILLEGEHVKDCPISKDVEKLELKVQKMDDANLIVKIWNRYPKQLALLIIVGVIITLGTFGYSIYVMKTMLPHALKIMKKYLELITIPIAIILLIIYNYIANKVGIYTFTWEMFGKVFVAFLMFLVSLGFIRMLFIFYFKNMNKYFDNSFTEHKIAWGKLSDEQRFFYSTALFVSLLLFFGLIVNGL